MKPNFFRVFEAGSGAAGNASQVLWIVDATKIKNQPKPNPIITSWPSRITPFSVWAVGVTPVSRAGARCFSLVVLIRPGSPGFAPTRVAQRCVRETASCSPRDQCTCGLLEDDACRRSALGRRSSRRRCAGRAPGIGRRCIEFAWEACLRLLVWGSRRWEMKRVQ